MAVLAALTMFAAIAALVFALSGRRVAARAPIDRRLARAGGTGLPDRDTATAGATAGPALRDGHFGKDGLGRSLATVPSLQRLGPQIERAGWRLSVTEFVLLSAVCGAVPALLAWSRLPLLTVPAGLVGALLPLLAMKRAVKKRRDTFNKQLVDALAMLANSIRAGVGLMQAIDQAASQLKPPVSVEFQRTLHDIQMGATPDDAFEALNTRVGSEDLDIVITAIIVQRSTGGNLAEILQNVAQMMRERIRIRGEIKTLTTQQQMSGYLLAAIPLGLLLMFTLISPDYMAPLYNTTVGRVVLGAGGILQLMGFLIIGKIVNIEV